MLKFLCILLVLPFGANAVEMTPVGKATGYCASNQESYCFEWSFASDEGLRFVANGDEDDIDYAFYRVGAGKYRKLADVSPLLEDASMPGQLFWGYPWDITGIKVDSAGRAPSLMATRSFAHAEIDLSTGQPLPTQVMPAVLFVGRTTRPETKRDPIPLETVPIAEFDAWLTKPSRK
jgi:hypothetical protein